MVSGRTVVNAVIGAVVAIVLSFIPFSPILGGATAGFLEGPDGREGAISGTISGLIMFLPMAAVGMVGLTIFGFGFGFVGMPATGAAVGLLFLGTLVGSFFVYIVGLSLLGGLIGAYLAREYPEQHTSARETIGMTDRSRGAGRPLEAGRQDARGAGTDRSPVDDDSLEDDPFGPADGERVDDHESDSYWDRDRPPLNTDTDGDPFGSRESDAGGTDDEDDLRNDSLEDDGPPRDNDSPGDDDLLEDDDSPETDRFDT